MRNPALSPAWNGWGPDHRNNRAAPNAGVNAANLSRLRLKWVYGLPGEDQPRAQPAVADGRLFVGNKAGALYSLDAKTGCTYWTYLPRNGIRSAISVGPVVLADGSDGYAVYFVDLRANVYAVNAQTGEELWTTRVETHLASEARVRSRSLTAISTCPPPAWWKKPLHRALITAAVLSEAALPRSMPTPVR